MSDSIDTLLAVVRERLQPLRDPEYAAALPTTMPGLTDFEGVRVPELRSLADDLRREYQLKVIDWVHYLSKVFPTHHRELILVGLYGLNGKTADLDDLFGERMSGWARHLDNWETTDALGPAAGAWVADDLSRIGYPEAWAVRGESVWKKRLGAVTAVYLNRHGDTNTHAALRVLRHLMTTDQPELRKAVAWALREQKDQEAVERFLAWWAPRVSRGLISEASNKLPESSRERLRRLQDGLSETSS